MSTRAVSNLNVKKSPQAIFWISLNARLTQLGQPYTNFRKISENKFQKNFWNFGPGRAGQDQTSPTTPQNVVPTLSQGQALKISEIFQNFWKFLERNFRPSLTPIFKNFENDFPRPARSVLPPTTPLFGPGLVTKKGQHHPSAIGHRSSRFPRH